MTPLVHKAIRSLRPYQPEFVSTDALQRVLSRLDFDVLGAGMYGVVVDMGDFVLKLFSADDEAYLDFLDFCEEVDSPYLPAVLWDMQVNEKIWAVCLEKLEPLVEDTEYTCDSEVENEDYQLIRKYIKAKNGLHIIPRFPPYIENRDMKAVIDLLLEKQQEEEHWSDLHCGNVMLRGEQLVITDPWC